MKQVEKFVVTNILGSNHVFRFKSFTRPWLYESDVLYGIDYLGLENDKGEPLQVLTMDTVDKVIHCLRFIEIPEEVLKEFISFVSLFTHKDVEGKEFKIANEVELYFDGENINPVGYDITHIDDKGITETFAYVVYLIKDYV